MPRCLAAALFAAFVLFAAAPPAFAASFDCGRASTALEKAVCQDRTLSALDEEMAQNYLGLLRRISGRNESLMKAEQKTWLKQRNACDADERCIAAQYRARIQRIAEVASSEGLIVLPKRSAATPAPAAASPSRSVFQPSPATASTTQSPATAAAIAPPTTAPIRTTAQEAAAPTRAEGFELPQPKSSGLINKVLSKVAPNLIDRTPEPAMAETLNTPPEPRRDTVRREDRVRNQSVLPGDDPFADEIVRREPERRKVNTTREPAATAATETPIALQAPKEEKKRKSEPVDDPGAPAVLLYTTPDTSNVIRMPDGESPFDQLDAQNAFEPPPGRPLTVTPRNLPQPVKKAFDSGRFDAFNESPNG